MPCCATRWLLAVPPLKPALQPVNDASQHAELLERRTYELSVLSDVARTLNASLDLPSLLKRALEKVAELLGLETGWVLLLDESTGEPYVAAAQNLPPGLRCEPDRMTGWCYCLRSFTEGTMPGAANVGVVKCSRLRALALAKGDTAGLRFHASVPLKVYDNETTGDEEDTGMRRLGMLNVASPEWREITEDELDLLRTIGGLLGVAIERAQLHARRLEAAQTEERLRMAREIHDTIAQDFSAIAFQLDTAEVLLDEQNKPKSVLEHIQTARELAGKGLQDARRSVFDLRATPLEGRQLADALRALAEKTDTQHELTVAFEAPPALGSLPPAAEVGLYRIGQEALRNALRHAAAGHVTLRLDTSSNAMRLRIEDDGQGFDAEGVLSRDRASGRFGLVGMRERARLLGGTLRVESTPGVGTRITAHVPLSTGSSS